MYCEALTVLFLSCILLHVEAAIRVEDGLPVATTGDGPLRGKVLSSRNGRDYYAFRGIKYGVIPSRFELAVQPEPWTDIVDASNFGSKCPQVGIHTGAVYATTEHCLFLNVYVPAAVQETKQDIPVMFWVHGGGFLDGAGSHFGADFIMDEDVILVTINYRLGILGFLNTEDGTAPANVGLKDMIFALKWVQRNIAAFGGDPKKVTIFGESAGAVSVHLLMLSPAANGLFRAVIAQSGSALTSWSINPSPRTAIDKVATALECPQGLKLLQCLKETNLERLLIAMKDVSFSNNGFADLVFAPSVESFFASTDDFLAIPDNPYNLITRYTNSKDVPLIIGTNEKEGILLYAGAFLTNDMLLSELIRNWVPITSKMFSYANYVPEGELNTFGETLKSMYFGQSKISKVTGDKLIQMFTQLLFERGSRLSTEFHAHYGSTVFPYVITHRGEFSLSLMMGLPSEGPTHADEMQYLFPSLLSPIKNWPDLKPNSTDEDFSKKLVKLWASFAIHGKPTESWGDEWEPVNFEHFETKNYPIMRLDTTATSKKESDDDFAKIVHADIMFAVYEKPQMSWRANQKLRDEL